MLPKTPLFPFGNQSPPAIFCGALPPWTPPTGLNAAALLEQIRLSRERLTKEGIAPLTDAFLDEAKREGRP